MAGNTNKIVLVVSADPARLAEVSNKIEAAGGMDAFPYPSCDEAHVAIADMLRSATLPDAVVTDYTTGSGMNGPQLAASLRSLSPARNMPIFMFSDHLTSFAAKKDPNISDVFNLKDIDALIGNLRAALKLSKDKPRT